MDQDKYDLFEKNQKLVFYVLNKYYPTYTYDEDLIQDAMLGLWKAVLTFDNSKGYKFSTYASRCVLNEINMVLRSRNSKSKYDITLVSLDDVATWDQSRFDNHARFHDIVADPRSEYPMSACEIEACLEQEYKNYSPKVQRMIALSFKGMTQKEIAKELGLSKSYVNKCMILFNQRFKSMLKQNI